MQSGATQLQQRSRRGALIACSCGTKLSLSIRTVASCERAGAAQCTRPSCFVSSPWMRAPTECGTLSNNAPSEQPSTQAQAHRKPGPALVLLQSAAQRAARSHGASQRCGRRAGRYVGLTRASSMFVPAADTREAWKLSTEQAYQAST